MGDICKALTAPKAARLTNAATLLTSSIRVAYASAFLEEREALKADADSDRAVEPVQRAIALRADALEFLALLPLAQVCKHPHSQSRLASLALHIRSVTGPPPDHAQPAPTPERAPTGPKALIQFEHSSHMCVAALCAGWEPAECTNMWARAQLGFYSKSGKTFFPGPRTPQSAERDWPSTEVRFISRAPGETLWVCTCRKARSAPLPAPNRSEFRPPKSPVRPHPR